MRSAEVLGLYGLAVFWLAVGGWAAAVPSAPPGTITWTTALGEVVFPHQLHVEDLGVECDGCHHETRAAPLAMPHPQYFEDFWIDCASCHGLGASAGRPRACSACHPSTPTGVADETSSSKVVIHQSCWECHEVTGGQEASRSCMTCHPRFAVPEPGETPDEARSSSGKEGSR